MSDLEQRIEGHIAFKQALGFTFPPQFVGRAAFW